jgi:two-component system, response regulator
MLPDRVDVLIVDADPLEVELLLRALDGVWPDVRIGVAHDGEEALDFLLARGSYRHLRTALLPRLVLLEYKLPRLDGVEVLRAIRTNPRAAATPVVMLTSSAESREIAQCYHAGANSCVEKPVIFGDFQSTVQELGRYWLGVNQVNQLPASHS